MIDPLFISAFIMGLIGSGHCIAMCGGIASSLQLATDKRRPLAYSLAYNLGRATSYMLAGALVAGISSHFASQSMWFSLLLAFLSGLFMLLVGMYVMRLGVSLQWLESVGKTLIWQHLVKLNRFIMPINSLPKAAAYGALWGWLPCGLVYSALTWAMTSTTAIDGAIVMLFFALGTFPAMLSIGMGAQFVHKILNHPWARIAMGSILIWYGIYLLIIATDKLVH
ncbi:sulfite exporter TauE/SafE family protein [Pseudoalteromonas shioyasakiensis]|uniref:sulfite exporter TauE/SafE family protein n=1 Tax=Pseudoalteromonas shioyasakiensis TaxID=1190813 RepID=UPI0021198EE8|nr:sulfite exporter TauE/SafE family protein [Pseudoalteromonas shioyasakiensis]MCQ8877045.1 sulfite exporter TauE/SafE family protein [Pseudoalteromonas shioyasakiensis]